MLNNHTANIYETPYNGTFVILQCQTDGMVMSQCGAIKIRYNSRRIQTYPSDTNVDHINPEVIIDKITLEKYQLYYLYYILDIGTNNIIKYAQIPCH